MDYLSDYISISWIYYGLMFLYVASVLSVVVVILSENRNPVKSLAWVTVLLVVPGLGLILYFFFGRSIQKKRIISRKNQRRLRRKEAWGARPGRMTLHLSASAQQQVKLGTSLTGALLYEGNDIELFIDAREKMTRLIEDINNAKYYILVEYYIIHDDNIGNRFREALISAAGRGVKIRIIYDHVGSFSAKKSFWQSMKDAGIEVYPFFKVVFPLFGTRINWRNHRKIIIIDGKIGYIGGMNVADRYMTGRWHDLHLRIIGPAVSAMQYNFAVDWNFMGQPLITEWRKADYIRLENPIGIQMITSGPTGHWPNLAMMFQKAIANAQKRVYVMTPYFLPDESLLRTLQTAALSHVDVRILIPFRPDSVIMRHASFSYVTPCIKSGIKVYLYNDGMMHSKAVIIDDDLVTTGSTNFDFRSFEHNFEANLFIYSKDFNHRLTEEFHEACNRSVKVDAVKWKHRPLKARVIESLVRLLAPVL